MKIAICDDDVIFLDTISSLLEKWAEKKGISLTVYPFQSGDSLLLTLQKEYMDLIFLDIVMPLINGIEIAKELRNINQTTPIIFLSFSKEFAVDSYEVKAFHYLLKPVTEEKLFAVLNDFFKDFEKSHETFIAQTAEGFCKIKIADVVYLEAQNKQVNVYLSNGTVIKIRELFSKCEGAFSINKGFYKSHRSYIVNLNCITQFTKTQITTNTDAVIPVSRNNYADFKEFYLKHMFQ